MAEGGIRRAEHLVGDAPHGDAEAGGRVAFWTAERVEELLFLWSRGNSTTQIGVALGCSRNAVIGKLHRLDAPEPAEKLPVIRNRVYISQMSEVARAKNLLCQKRYRQRRKERERRENIAIFKAKGASPYSAAFRKHLPPQPEMTKGELRAMLAQAVLNTAALS